MPAGQPQKALGPTGALFNVTPTTFDGALTLLTAIAAYDEDEDSNDEDGDDIMRGQSALEWRGGDGGPGGKVVKDTLLEIAYVLRQAVRS
jgi:hypothetical protein